MVRSKMLLTAFFVCAIAASGWAAPVVNDVNTIACWHMTTFDVYTIYFSFDDVTPVSYAGLSYTRGTNFLLLVGDPAYHIPPDPCCPTVITGAPDGNALSFDGVAQYAKNQYPSWKTTYSAFAVDMEFQAQRAAGTQTLIEATNTWSVSLSGSNVVLTVYTGGSPRVYTLTSAVALNTWQHVTASCTAAGHVTFKLDALTPVAGDGLPVIQQVADANISLGNTLGSSKYFKGYIDEVKVSVPGLAATLFPFTVPLTDQPTTKALWHFDSVNPTTYQFMDDDSAHITRNADLDRYNNTTKVTDTTTAPFSVDPSTFIPPYGETSAVGYPAGNPAFGNSVYFDGISDRCQILDTKLPAIDGNSLTIQFWMRPDDAMQKWGDGADHYWQMVDRWNQVMIWFREYGSTGHLVLQALSYAKNGVGSTISYDMDAKSFNYKQWMHIKYTCIGTAVTLYLNGTSIGTATLSVAGLQAPNQTNTFIGSRYERSRTFWGFMDEFRIDSIAHCGDAGYNQMDLNKDCVVDMKDLQTVALGWLSANPYSGNSGSSNYPAPVEQKWADTGNFNIPQATVTPTIDGVFHASEWADARTVEMINPTLITPPNVGYVDTRSPKTAPTASDFSLYWYLKWDSSYLYVAGVVYDNDVNPGAGFDEPQIGFNFNNVATHTYLTQAYLWNMKSDNTWNTNGGSAPSSNTFFNRVNNPAGLAGYVIEAKLKWSDIACDNSAYVPVVGDKHGLIFYCQDMDMSGNPTHALMCYPDFRVSVLSEWSTITLVNTIDCHEKLQNAADFNSDCNVNFKDFAQFASNWLSCTDPSGLKCKM